MIGDWIVLGTGTVLCCACMLAAWQTPNPSPTQHATFRTVLALGSGLIAGAGPGFLGGSLDSAFIAVRVGGGLLIFLIVYLSDPVASLPPRRDDGTGDPERAQQTLQLSNPIVIDFFGRTNEFNRLLELLAAPSKVAIVGLHGYGGVGKTSTAIQFHLTYAPRFPGGLLWANAGTNADDGERSTTLSTFFVEEQTLLEWERRLGGTPSNVQRTIAALRTTVKGLLQVRIESKGPCLVIIDNVDDQELMQRLLDVVSDCPVILTTRQMRLAKLANVRPLAIGGLEPEAAKLLFMKEGGENAAALSTESVDALLKDVEYHPLGVKLVAQIIATQGQPDPAAVRREIARATVPADAVFRHIPNSLRACFAVSIRALETRPVKGLRPLLFSMASQATSGASLEAIADVSGVLRLEPTRAMLAELRARGFVEDVGTNQFRIHRLLQDYIRATYGTVGWSRLPRGWDLPILPILFMLFAPGVAGGQSAYDRRHENHFLRRARRARSDGRIPESDRDAILSIVGRMVGDEQALKNKLTSVAQFLTGVDLSGRRWERVLLEKANLEAAKLEDADWSGAPLRWLRPWSEVRRMGRRLVARSLLWGLVMLLSVEGLLQLFLAQGDLMLVSTPEFLAFGLLPLCAYSAEALVRAVVGGGRLLHRLEYRAKIVAERSMAGVLAMLIAGSLIPAIIFRVQPASTQAGWYVNLIAAVPALTLTFLSVAIQLGIRASRRANFGGLATRIVSALVGASVCIMMIVFIGWFSQFFFGNIAEAEAGGGATGIYCVVYAAAHDPDSGSQGWSIATTYLRWSNLARANLRNAKFDWVQLDGATLLGARMRGISLRNASLRRCNLRDAELRNADLRGADLRKADLRGADLREADLTDANLTGADLTSVRLDHAVLVRTRLPKGFSPGTPSA